MAKVHYVLARPLLRLSRKVLSVLKVFGKVSDVCNVLNEIFIPIRRVKMNKVIDFGYFIFLLIWTPLAWYSSLLAHTIFHRRFTKSFLPLPFHAYLHRLKSNFP